MTTNQTAPCEGEAKARIEAAAEQARQDYERTGLMSAKRAHTDLLKLLETYSPAPTAPVGVDREKVARIIDPAAFATLRQLAKERGLDAENPPASVGIPYGIDEPIPNRQAARETALAKADAILALSASPQPGERQGYTPTEATAHVEGWNACLRHIRAGEAQPGEGGSGEPVARWALRRPDRSYLPLTYDTREEAVRKGARVTSVQLEPKPLYDHPASDSRDGAVEALREALIQADLKIRSFPGADQSDVEFIREALSIVGGAPADEA